MSPVEVVQRQLDAYNAHDLAAFLATYSETAELMHVASSSLQSKGDTLSRSCMGRRSSTFLTTVRSCSAASPSATRSSITSVYSVFAQSHSRQSRCTKSTASH